MTSGMTGSPAMIVCSGYDNRLKPVPGAEDALGGEIRPILGEGEFQDRQKVHPRLALKIF
jgi:hypothetical protein